MARQGIVNLLMCGRTKTQGTRMANLRGEASVRMEEMADDYARRFPRG
jgi:hypothetical protein